MGVPGYYCAKIGLGRKEPRYTVPRDENSNFFKQVTKATRGVPGPNVYDNPLSWKTNNGNFGIGPKRTTFTDDAEKHSKQVPSSAQYNPELKRKLLLGHLSKAEGINYLSDACYLAATQPNCATYKDEVSRLFQRFIFVLFINVDE